MAILTLRPESDEFTSLPTKFPNSGGFFDKVNESVADEDTTYIETAGEGSMRYARFGLPNHTVESGPINHVTVYIRCKRNGGTATNLVRTLLRTHGSSYQENRSEQDTYTTFYSRYTTNPSTGLAWTWTEIDDLIIGVSMNDDSLGNDRRCTQVYAEVNYGGTDKMFQMW